MIRNKSEWIKNEKKIKWKIFSIENERLNKKDKTKAEKKD